MIEVEHEQLTERVPVLNRIFSCDWAEEQLYPLLERAEDRFN